MRSVDRTRPAAGESRAEPTVSGRSEVGLSRVSLGIKVLLQDQRKLTAVACAGTFGDVPVRLPTTVERAAIVGFERRLHLTDMFLVRVGRCGPLFLGRIAGPPFAAIGFAIEADSDDMGFDHAARQGAADLRISAGRLQGAGR